MWKIIQSPEFEDWFIHQDLELQEDVFAIVRVLEKKGPSLGRPYVDTLKGSKIPNLKELRIQSKGRPIRILFAFDTERKAVLLTAGNKQGDKRFYAKLIFQAERIYEDYLGNIQ
ncbi:type II toxin-antitoxin system RelE/ParE family toxin [Leptospira neocaledonica]|uniref:Diaminopimelate decarboxylase n=1 Tax=Leptospira neocaledonica TaxID=2023192 RepID=A0A2N0A2R6_9LEPT|nr:type II toxin-antitoxin system RelE/ParE family toxin [Leptospira neocaledonica]PJZ78501.1 diaminopimelate decarboxylase [Leptospira neocaledonica]